MLKRIQFRLLLSYLFLSLNLILLAGVAFYYAKRAEELRNSQSKILEADLKFQKLINTDLLIINRETVSNDFFKAGRSPLLSEHHALTDEIQTMLFDIKTILNSSSDTENDTVLVQINNTLTKYNENFNQYLHIVFLRGFRDFGLEGKMRDKAHLLERMNIVTKEEILYLRRHEKDFFIRKDTLYVIKFNKLCNELIAKNKSNASFRHEQEILESYCEMFNEIARIDTELGLSEKQGYRYTLHSHVVLLENLFSKLLDSSRVTTQKKLTQGEFLFYISIAISLALSIILSIIFSSQISKPVKKLAQSMDSLVLEQDSFKYVESEHQYDTEEIQTLWQSFHKMSVAIKKQFEEINDKSGLLSRQNERLNKLNKELDQFIYSASHDLKAPLSSLLGLINIVRIEIGPSVHDEYFDMMESSIKRLEYHIKDIIQYSKNHQLDITLQEIKLRNTIELIISQLKYQKGAEGMEIRIEVIAKVPFYSDSMRLNMVLFNLISNAFKYHDKLKEKKGIVISATIDTKNAQISVADNGLGIEKKYLDKIFELFFRGTIHSSGSGLGLFIAKEAIEKLKGSIKVKSEIGKGSVFMVNIPNHFNEIPTR
jgi:signal transduction histidine kinase